jgi:hypothetical protein
LAVLLHQLNSVLRGWTAYSPQAPSSNHRPQLAKGQGEGIVDPLGR